MRLSADNKEKLKKALRKFAVEFGIGVAAELLVVCLFGPLDSPAQLVYNFVTGQ